MRFSAAVVCSVVACCSFAQGISWAKDYASAQKSAFAKKCLVMIAFYKDKAPDTGAMDKATYGDPRVGKLAKSFVSVRLDVDKAGKSLISKYKIKAIPASLFVDPKGEEWGRSMGPTPATQFLFSADASLRAFTMWPGVQAGLAKNPKDAQANTQAAFVYAVRGKFKEAEVAFGLGSKSGKIAAQAANALGDHFQTDGRLQTAIPWFEKAEKAADALAEREYALVSLLSCQLGTRDADAAKTSAKRLKALKGANPEYLRLAEQVLRGGR